MESYDLKTFYTKKLKVSHLDLKLLEEYKILVKNLIFNKDTLEIDSSFFVDEFNKEITNPVQPTYPYKAKYIGKYIFENNCIRYLYKGESYEEDEMNCPGKLERILYHGDSDE